MDHAKVRRAAAKVGRRLERERRVRIGQRRGRYYGPEDLGPLCAAGCGTRIVQALQAAGITEHPACGSSTRQAAKAEARAAARAAAKGAK